MEKEDKTIKMKQKYRERTKQRENVISRDRRAKQKTGDV